MQACPLPEIILYYLRSFAVLWYTRGVYFTMSSKQMKINCISSRIKSERVDWEWELFTCCIQWFPRKHILWFREIKILITLLIQSSMNSQWAYSSGNTKKKSYKISFFPNKISIANLQHRHGTDVQRYSLWILYKLFQYWTVASLK